MHILLIEDNLIDIEIISNALLKENHRKIEVYKYGQDALKRLQEESDGCCNSCDTPDIIILDLNLPDHSGIDLLRLIKSYDHLKSVPVIVFSSSDSSLDILAAYDLYANCFIQKPINGNNFAQIISTITNFWCNTVQLPPKPEYH